MAVKDEMFSLKEVAFSALKGMASQTSAEYKTVVHNTSSDMENAKMIDGIFVNGKFYEFKVTKRRDRIEGDYEPIKMKDKVKNDLLSNYHLYVFKNYPILRIHSTIDKIFITHCEVDYEITFILKRGISHE